MQKMQQTYDHCYSSQYKQVTQLEGQVLNYMNEQKGGSINRTKKLLTAELPARARAVENHG